MPTPWLMLTVWAPLTDQLSVVPWLLVIFAGAAVKLAITGFDAPAAGGGVDSPHADVRRTVRRAGSLNEVLLMVPRLTSARTPALTRWQRIGATLLRDDGAQHKPHDGQGHEDYVRLAAAQHGNHCGYCRQHPGGDEAPHCDLWLGQGISKVISCSM